MREGSVPSRAVHLSLTRAALEPVGQADPPLLDFCLLKHVTLKQVAILVTK